MKSILRGIWISFQSLLQSIFTMILAIAISSIIVKIFNVMNDYYIPYIFITVLSVITFYVIYKNIKEIVKRR